jgi:hypothetical protein
VVGGRSRRMFQSPLRPVHGLVAAHAMRRLDDLGTF